MLICMYIFIIRAWSKVCYVDIYFPDTKEKLSYKLQIVFLSRLPNILFKFVLLTNP